MITSSIGKPAPSTAATISISRSYPAMRELLPLLERCRGHVAVVIMKAAKLRAAGAHDRARIAAIAVDPAQCRCDPCPDSRRRKSRCGLRPRRDLRHILDQHGDAHVADIRSAISRTRARIRADHGIGQQNILHPASHAAASSTVVEHFACTTPFRHAAA